jgi:hypothetical protein
MSGRRGCAVCAILLASSLEAAGDASPPREAQGASLLGPTEDDPWRGCGVGSWVRRRVRDDREGGGKRDLVEEEWLIGFDAVGRPLIRTRRPGAPDTVGPPVHSTSLEPPFPVRREGGGAPLTTTTG